MSLVIAIDHGPHRTPDRLHQRAAVGTEPPGSPGDALLPGSVPGYQDGLMPSMRRRGPEQPPGTPQIQVKPGTAKEMESVASAGVTWRPGSHRRALCWPPSNGSFVAMPPWQGSPSPEVAALRIATEGICKQLRDQARKQARLIRSGAADELTEADVERMARDIAAAARAELEVAAPDCQSPSADPELDATRQEAAQLMAAVARQVDAELREAWRARHEKATRRSWRR